MDKINIRVEYECNPIRHLALQCPYCNNWFQGDDIYNELVSYNYQLYELNCECPKCYSSFKILILKNVHIQTYIKMFKEKSYMGIGD